MRILYTAFDVVPSPKGSSVHITQFVQALAGAGHTVHLITPGDGILPASDSYGGAQVTRVPPGDDMNFLTRAIAFGQAVMAHVAGAELYDVVHYRSIWSGLHLTQARAQYGYRTLFEVNGLPSIELKYHYPDLRSSDLLLKMREQEMATLALSDAVVCPSGVTAAYVRSLGVPAERIALIRNGFDQTRIVPAPLPITQPHADYVPTLLYIGTLAEWQGLDLLLEALPLVLEQQAVHLRIVGRGRSHQRKRLNKRIYKLQLTEYVSLEEALPHDDMPAVIASADVCVAPLMMNDRNVVQGCCPIKLIEYMGAGRPIVAANLPVVRELVREDVDALLFAPGDRQDLAHQIVRVLADPALAARLAAAAATQAHAHLTWRQSCQQLIDLYTQWEPDNQEEML